MKKIIEKLSNEHIKNTTKDSLNNTNSSLNNTQKGEYIFEDCKEIKEKLKTPKNGDFFLFPKCINKKIEAYCDFSIGKGLSYHIIEDFTLIKNEFKNFMQNFSNVVQDYRDGR